ncbi:MAG: PBP1A family penicillin-binding protein [Candidatus Obscuribacterales bacterium]|nr:PBP1A family penicillin-binding protein [Candidatus Obscuribacterales bacterium]
MKFRAAALAMKHIRLLLSGLTAAYGALATVGRRTCKSTVQRFGRASTFRAGLRHALILLGVSAATFSAGLALWCLWLCSTLPPAELEIGVAIYDRNEHLVCRAYDDERLVEPVPLKSVSKWVAKAVIASEDKTFLDHHGVSAPGMMRALVANVSERKVVQGGSTITQQLAKNLYFSGEGRRFSRKIKDAAMAISLERKYSKDQILEAYLNTTYFGTGAYGIERAARTYFGKTSGNLTLSESAYLAGLINAPSKLSKKANFDDAIGRRNRLLKEMKESGVITEKEAANALKHKPTFQGGMYVPPSSFYVNEVLKTLREPFGRDEMYSKGLHVFTFMDSAAQKLATAKLAYGIKHAPPGVREGALVSVSVADGGVLSIVGGVDGRRSQWNRALSPHMAGSAFKPFVYLAGLNTGKLGPDSLLLDAPFNPSDPSGGNYNPQNYDGHYLGWISTRKAIALSRNTCAVRVAQAVSPHEVIRTARKAGIKSRMDATPSIALGSCSVSPLEIATAYATLARGGEAIEPRLIKRVEDRDKKVLRTYDAESVRVFDPEPVAALVDALQDVVETGTGTRARLANRPAAGKTGTSDGPTDIWFVGFTTDVVTAVWGGNDEFKPIAGSHVTGGTVMAKIWQNYMASYYRAHPTPVTAFARPLNPLVQDDSAPSFYEVAPPIIGELMDLMGRSIVREYGHGDYHDEEDDAAVEGEHGDEGVRVDERQSKVAQKPKLFRRIVNFVKSL